MATPIPTNHARFSIDEIVSVTGASILRPCAADAVEGVITDSRRVASGQLFVALRGDVHDGHRYCQGAAERGAAALLVEEEVEVSGAAGVLQVSDTLDALGQLAAAHRRKFDAPVVAITGSVGKTSTKELVAAGLRGLGHHVVATHGNLNNRIGAPLTLLMLDETHDAAVIEIGMSVQGEIALLAQMVRPTVGVVTAVAEAHTEGVGDLAGVAEEKGALLRALEPEAAAVYTADDQVLLPHAQASGAAAKLSFGLTEGASVRLVRWEVDPRPATLAHFKVGERSLSLTLSLLGQGAAVNTAAALAVLSVLAPDQLEKAASVLEQVHPPAGRMSPLGGPGESLIIDDTYNASPRSTVGALETSAAIARARGARLIAVLGDMLELGGRTTACHEMVGREAVRVGAAALIATGTAMKQAAEAARQAAVGSGASIQVAACDEADQATESVMDLVEAGDVVLVKGSRSMRMERVVHALREGER